jgi:hypothetical protein
VESSDDESGSSDSSDSSDDGLEDAAGRGCQPAMPRAAEQVDIAMQNWERQIRRDAERSARADRARQRAVRRDQMQQERG